MIPCRHARILMDLQKTMTILMHNTVLTVIIVALKIWIASDEKESSATVLKQDV